VGKSTTSNTPDRGAKAECSKRQDAIALRDTFIGALSAPSVGAAETQMNWHASLSSWSSLIDGACSTMRNLTRLETTVEWFVGLAMFIFSAEVVRKQKQKSAKRLVVGATAAATGRAGHGAQCWQVRILVIDGERKALRRSSGQTRTSGLVMPQPWVMIRQFD
jgi:hypothetical protein